MEVDVDTAILRKPGSRSPYTEIMNSLCLDENTVAFSLCSGDGKWECSWCSSKVANKSYLASHVRRDHEGGVWDLKCTSTCVELKGAFAHAASIL